MKNLETMKYLRYTILAIAVFFTSACEDYLDKSPEMGVTDAQVYSRYQSFKGAFDKVYFQDQEFFIDGWNGYVFSLGDEGVTTASGDPAKSINTGNYMDGTSVETDWGLKSSTYSDLRRLGIPDMCFRNLRTINICLERLGDIEDATPQQLQELEGQAYFKRAWNYFQLIRRFGGFFKFDKAFASDDDMDLPRLSYQESTDWLVSDLDRAFELLPDKWPDAEKGRVTKTACLALKSMALLYAASPNMNDNKQYNIEYCKLAAQAAAEAINYVNSNNYYRLMPGGTAEEYAKIFYSKTQLVSDEAILYTVTQDYTDGPGKPRSRQWLASFVPRTRGATNLHMASPTQNFVDLFEMANGLPIHASGSGYNDQDPYSNRDPRFYYDILTNGTPWNFETPGNRKPMEFWRYDTYLNQKSHDGTAIRDNYPGTPYAIRKWWPESCNIWENDFNYYMQSIHIRVAQLYLDFAEAANEAYGPNGTVPGTSLTAVDAINIIRNRVGAVDVLPEFTSSKEIFRERIWNERSVELCFENQRWHDIRRWRIAHEVMNDLWTAVITRIGPDQYTYAYEPISTFYAKNFEEKHYWYPIPIDQMDILSNFTQNPGW
jgi:starch-binding outer membrane protein, SusD/RagB family